MENHLQSEPHTLSLQWGTGGFFRSPWGYSSWMALEKQLRKVSPIIHVLATCSATQRPSLGRKSSCAGAIDMEPSWQENFLYPSREFHLCEGFGGSQHTEAVLR